MSEQKTKKPKTEAEIKDDKYYDVLKFLDKAVESKKLPKSTLLTFKEMIRDNKYVSVYIRSLKKSLESIDDYPAYFKRQETWHKDYVSEQFIHPNVTSIFWLNEIDPIKVIKKTVMDALAREGKVCVFDDSVNPQTKFGFCQCEYHNEDPDDDDVRIKEELFLTLYCDDDTSKFDDNLPEYICKKCIDNCEVDCEVSCDME